jgi:hypothetical protein
VTKALPTDIDYRDFDATSVADHVSVLAAAKLPAGALEVPQRAKYTLVKKRMSVVLFRFGARGPGCVERAEGPGADLVWDGGAKPRSKVRGELDHETASCFDLNPKIVQIFTDCTARAFFSICGNLRNLWITNRRRAG